MENRSLKNLLGSRQYNMTTILVLKVLKELAKGRTGRELVLTFEPLGGVLYDSCSTRYPGAPWAGAFSAIRGSCVDEEFLDGIGVLEFDGEAVWVAWDAQERPKPETMFDRRAAAVARMRADLEQIREGGYITHDASERLDLGNGAQLWVRRWDVSRFEHFDQFLLYAGVAGWGSAYRGVPVDEWYRGLRNIMRMPPWGLQILNDIRRSGVGGCTKVLEGVYTAQERDVDVLLDSVRLFARYEDGFISARPLFPDDVEYHETQQPEPGTVRLFSADSGPDAVWIADEVESVVARCVAWNTAGSRPRVSAVAPCEVGCVVSFDGPSDVDEVLGFAHRLSSLPSRRVAVQVRWSGTSHLRAASDPRPNYDLVVREFHKSGDLTRSVGAAYLHVDGFATSEDHTWWPGPFPSSSGRERSI